MEATSTKKCTGVPTCHNTSLFDWCGLFAKELHECGMAKSDAATVLRYWEAGYSPETAARNLKIVRS